MFRAWLNLNRLILSISYAVRREQRIDWDAKFNEFLAIMNKMLDANGVHRR